MKPDRAFALLALASVAAFVTGIFWAWALDDYLLGHSAKDDIFCGSLLATVFILIVTVTALTREEKR